MRVWIVVAALLAAGTAQAQGSHAVRGYTKADGTYVAPHQATNPNSTKTDNWSSKPNVNPYTGQEGTKDPYKVDPPKAPKPPKY